MRILFDRLILNHFEDKSFLTSSISTDFQASFIVTVQENRQESVLANSSHSCREEIIYNTACPVNSERCLFFINTGKRFYRKLTKSPQGLQIRNANLHDCEKLGSEFKSSVIFNSEYSFENKNMLRKHF